MAAPIVSLFAALLGCAGPGAAPHAGITLEVESPGPRAGGVSWLHVAMERPQEFTVAIDGRHATFPASRTSLPILGGIGQAVAVAVTAGAATAEVALAGTDLPAGLPVVEVLALDAARREPGWILLEATGGADIAGWLLALDERGEIGWWWSAGTAPADARLAADGTLWFLTEGAAANVDWFGRPLGALPALDLNHELHPIEGGFLTISRESVDVAAYPLAESTPEVLGPATIDGGEILDLAHDGTVRRRWLLSDVLDPVRIGFGSLSTVAAGFDWSHPNGVVPDGEGLLVSARHQDAVVRLDGAGALDWILGTPAGWVAPWSDHLLVPGGDVVWPFHAHAPEVTADGTVVVFDNHNFGFTPYGEPVEPLPSAVAGFRVEAGVVSSVFRFDDTATGPLYAWAAGDVDVLPETGNFLVNYGLLDSEGGVSHADLGWGAGVARIVEYAPDGAVVLDVRLRSDLAVAPAGWNVYRVEHFADPWGDAGSWAE